MPLAYRKAPPGVDEAALRVSGGHAHPILSSVFEALCRLVFRVWCRLTVSGLEHIPPGPFIVCSNHQSHLDSVALMTATGRGFHRFGLLAAKDYFFERPLTRRLSSPFLNLIPVARAADPRALQRTLALCRRFVDEQQGSLIVYPEGGRSRDGRLRPFKRGALLFANELQLPIVPAYVEGSGAAMPPGALFPRPGRIHVRFGSPLAPHADEAVASRRRPLYKATEDLEQRVHQLKAADSV